MMTKRDKTKSYKKIENKGWKEICQANSNQKHLILGKLLKTKGCNNHLYAPNKMSQNPKASGRLRP